MNEEEKELIQLINDYISCAKYSLELLKEIYPGDESFLYAYKILKLIPKEGYIGDVYYNFHGRGCYFKYPELSIDIDFAPGGRKSDGFDLYRLESFLEFKKGSYPSLINKDN